MSTSNITREAEQQDNLAALAGRIRGHREEVKRALGLALDRALDIGDLLLQAQPLVRTNWKRWLRDNCLMGTSTALLYQQLARHRQEIEAEMSRVPEMTLRAARRLITTPKPRSAGTQGPRQAATKAAKPAPALNSLAWSGASPEARRRFLDAVGAASLLAALSDSMRQEIKRRLVAKAPRREKPADQPVGDDFDIPAICQRPRPAFDLELTATEATA